MEGSPSETGTAVDGGPRRTRGPREWAVDIALFLVAVCYGLAWAVALTEDPDVSQAAMLREQLACAAACAALWLRRRWPVGLALGLIPLSAYGALTDGAQLVALFTVAVHRPARTAALCGIATVVGQILYFAVFVLLAPPERQPVENELQWIVAFTAVAAAAVLGWGTVIRHRRQLVMSLRERAARAESEARLRAERAQMQARQQIAREMHDALGHRLSLLSVHAGALEYRPDAPTEEVARAAAVIRGSAHQALQDLREVIGVLRAPVGELPQPTLADVRGLVTESAAAGMPVELHEEVAGEAPGTIGRTAYRIVQEGLTNARRHAPGARVQVSLFGKPEEGLSVEVHSTAPTADGHGDPKQSPPHQGPSGARSPGSGHGLRTKAAPAGGAPHSGRDAASRVETAGGPGEGGANPAPGPGASATGGQGLIGLAERVSLVGGALSHGPDQPGGFRLHAWLPWPGDQSTP